jgi:hypothetical protein
MNSPSLLLSLGARSRESKARLLSTDVRAGLDEEDGLNRGGEVGEPGVSVDYHLIVPCV